MSELPDKYAVMLDEIFQDGNVIGMACHVMHSDEDGTGAHLPTAMKNGANFLGMDIVDRVGKADHIMGSDFKIFDSANEPVSILSALSGNGDEFVGYINSRVRTTPSTMTQSRKQRTRAATEIKQTRFRSQSRQYGRDQIFGSDVGVSGGVATLVCPSTSLYPVRREAA